MPIIELRTVSGLTAAKAAVIGATRALESAFPLLTEAAMQDRLSKAVAALIQVEAAADLQGTATAA